MAVPTELSALIGEWDGINHLWLSPEKPAQKSGAFAEVSTLARGQFIEIRYSWEYEHKPQEGVLIIGQGTSPNALKAIWIDSWHMKDDFMICEGTIKTDGFVSVKGSYAAPPGPDWGWQITIEPQVNKGAFRFVMDNISPEGEEMLAVEAIYKRLEQT
jgi:hypothetical protein